uniref:Uncharacterized protein n=1 Tax=Helianthus annuus TaxID=4232 RepID=A0A251USA5_HELAN
MLNHIRPSHHLNHPYPLPYHTSTPFYHTHPSTIHTSTHHSTTVFIISVFNSPILCERRRKKQF